MEVHCTSLFKTQEANPLFQDFVQAFDKVADWYTLPPVEISEWRRRAEKVVAQSGFPRVELIAALQDYNEELGAGEATRRNLERLSGADAVAVVSGQQVGLFGGPAYSVYKAAGAIQLAGRLQSEGLNAVPVFWLATNDSDFEEIRTAHYLSGQSEELSLPLDDVRSSRNQMAGTIPLGGIQKLLDDLADGFSKYEFGGSAIDALASAYSRDSTLGKGFGSWLAHLFQQQGLVILDPLLPRLRSKLQDFYSISVQQRDELNAALLARSRELEAAGYSPQVLVEDSETLLFLSDTSNRTKLRFENGRYLAKGQDEFRRKPGEMLRFIESEVERITPGVLIRPLLQDYLLPTLAYIGGPAEIAYFAQIQAISQFWDRDLLILPRASVTIVDRKSQRLLRKYDLTAEEVLSESSKNLAERIVKTTRASELLFQLELLETDLADRLNHLQPGLAQLDPTLEDMLSGVQEKMLYQLGKLKNRFVQNQQQRQPALERHLSHLQCRFTPHGKPQERVLGFSQFLAEEGPSLLDELLPHLAPGGCHKICFL